MASAPSDPLLDRVRAAGSAAGPGVVPSRERVTAARRRRAARHRRNKALVGAMTLLLATVALMGAPSSDGLDDPATFLSRAAEAWAMPPSSILVFDSTVRVRHEIGSFWQRNRVWMRISRSGRLVQFRELRTDGSEREAIGRELVGYRARTVRSSWTKDYDPRRRRIVVSRRTEATPATGWVADHRRLLKAAQTAGASVRIVRRDGYVAIVRDSRPFSTIVDHREVWLDPVTYAPFAYVWRERDIGQARVRIDYRFVERIHSLRKLPDTPGNRRLLQLSRRGVPTVVESP